MDINSIIEMINNTVRPIGKVHSPYRDKLREDNSK